MIEDDGFWIVPDVAEAATVQALITALTEVENESVSKRDSTFAIRNLLDMPVIQELARSAAIRNLVEPILGADCFAVRGIFFDKVPGANWKVPWHQDLSIAVAEKREVEGFGPWSEKAGAVHVQPPVAVLEQMMTFRLHLDDCSRTNGALRFIRGSHRLGRLSPYQIKLECMAKDEIVAEVELGSALLMRPLVLHASSPSHNPAHRRVVHLEFAAGELPPGLEWRWKV